MTGRLHTRTSTAAPLATRFHHAQFGLDLRFAGDADDEGTFEGYGSIFDVVDSYGTRMLPGCWGRGGLDEQPYALLWMHNPDVVLGTFTAREDDTGLLIRGQYDRTDVGQRARSQARSGSAPGLSVGFNVVQVREGDENALEVCTLVEVSQITARMASTPGAELAAVRSRDAETDRRRVAAARAAGLLAL